MAKISEIAMLIDQFAGEQVDLDLPDADYRLIDGKAWLTVKNIAIRIHETDEGVIVDLYPNGYETNNPLTSTIAFFTDAENEIQDAIKLERQELALNA
jgi:hypothetical protein